MNARALVAVGVTLAAQTRPIALAVAVDDACEAASRFPALLMSVTADA